MPHPSERSSRPQQKEQAASDWEIPDSGPSEQELSDQKRMMAYINGLIVVQREYAEK